VWIFLTLSLKNWTGHHVKRILLNAKSRTVVHGGATCRRINPLNSFTKTRANEVAYCLASRETAAFHKTKEFTYSDPIISDFDLGDQVL